jgi:hypothetical protein
MKTPNINSKIETEIINEIQNSDLTEFTDYLGISPDEFDDLNSDVDFDDYSR